MAAEDGLLTLANRLLRLPVVLGTAVVAVALAFVWVALAHQRPALDLSPARPAWLAGMPRAPGAAAATAPPAPAGRITVSVMTLGNELRPEQIAAFEADHPDTHVAFIEFSANLLEILLATNDLPDVFRLGPVEHRSLIRRGLLLDITERIERSERLSFDDMRVPSAAEVAVDGRYYGLPQGLTTPDFASLYINTSAFADAGIPVPGPSQPLTYAELAAIARQLAARTGRPAFYSYFFERTLSFALAQRGARMFNDDFTEMTLTRDPKALEVVRYFYELGRSGAMHVPPATPGIAFLFEAGELPISQSGYWMGAVVTPEMPAHGHVTMLPAPVWDRAQPRFSAYLGGTRLVIAASSKHPDQAYRFIEWYAAGAPAEERVRRGWGFPLLRSMESLLPQAGAFDQQRLRVALDSLKLPVVPLPEYPYPSILPAFNRSWTRNMALARSGRIDFAEFASNLQEDVNLAIQDDVASKREEPRR